MFKNFTEHSFLTSENLKIHYGKNFDTLNPKHPIIVFNYGLVCNVAHWEKQIPYYDQQGYQIIYHDYRFHFNSDRTSNIDDLSFENISKDNFSAIIDCDLQDPPELIARNFSQKEKGKTVHFIRTERRDGLFQKIYSNIAYKILYIISFGKIFPNAGYFKINPPNVTKKIKNDTKWDLSYVIKRKYK